MFNNGQSSLHVLSTSISEAIIKGKVRHKSEYHISKLKQNNVQVSRMDKSHSKTTVLAFNLDLFSIPFISVPIIAGCRLTIY